MVESLTREREVEGSIPPLCCVLEKKTHLLPEKYWLYPGSGGSIPT